MADYTSPMEGNNFENDFEKVDPLVTTATDDFVSSSGHQEDLFSGHRVAAAAEPAATAPLISLDDSTPTEPSFHPDSSSTIKDPISEVPKSDTPKKPQVSIGSSWVKNIDPRGLVSLSTDVVDLIYWRDIKKTGVVFGSMVVLLLSLACCSVLSVLAYLSLAALTVTVSFCVYKKVLQAVQKTGDGHPFKQYLDVEVTLSEDKVHEAADIVVRRAADTMRELRRLFLVEDLVDSLKFGLLLWVLTYIGSWFNGMTLIIIAVVAVFTLPKFYETNKTQIDQYVDLAKTQIRNVFKQIQEKIPLPGKKKQQ